jgi:hypothetical protein
MMRIDEAERGEKVDASGQGAIVESGQAQVFTGVNPIFSHLHWLSD